MTPLVFLFIFEPFCIYLSLFEFWNQYHHGTGSWMPHLVRVRVSPDSLCFTIFNGGVSLWRSRFQNGFSKTVSLFDQLLTIPDRFSSIDSVYILSNFRNDVIFSIFGSNSSGATPLNFRWLHVNNRPWVPLFFAISCSSRYILSTFYAQFWLSLVLRLFSIVIL